jgi:DNA polymerase-3 subunit alpha
MASDAPSNSIPIEGFAHLHLHTEYSLLDGGNRVDKLMDRCKALGMGAVACTDHGNMFGAVAFYLAAKERGIKPILGVEAYVAPGDRTDKTYTGVADGGYHLVLLAENNTGWNNLLYLCSEAFLTGFYYKPRIDRALLEKHNEGLIAINGHLGSEMGEHLLEFENSKHEQHWRKAVDSAVWHRRVFAPVTLADGTVAPRFYVELQHHVPEQNSINKHLIKLARELSLPLVCDNDSHFLRAEDHDSHDTLVCISTGKGKNDPDRMKYPRDIYVKSPDEMQRLFAPYGEAGKEALANTLAIAQRCNVTLPIGASNAPAVRVKLPAKKDLPKLDDERFAGDLTEWYKAYCASYEVLPMRSPTSDDVAQSKSECDAALRQLAEAGFIWRYGPGEWASETQSAKDKRARLERELKILADKNISAYFLIVWDFVSWGRAQGIPAMARGSGVGTMVGYVLGLSNACPVRFGLLFERFTDPDRSEYPDIDIDLCQDGRARVIDYVRKKYGHVAQIITFGTLKAKAAIRDVGRVLEMPLSEVDKIAKLVPEQLGMTLDKALEQEPDLKKLYDADPLVKRCIDNARGIEGQARHASVHAAGVIVATRPLHEIVPLYKASNSEDIVTQWDGPTCEKMGLLKMDFLGLRTASVVERAKRLIREGLSEREIWKAVGRDEDFDALQSSRSSASKSTKKSGSPVAHPLDLDRLNFDDQTVFEMFRRGDTTGVFQFESPGMRRLLVEMKPDRLEDLIAANALFRPGPMDLIPDYNRRKHGQDEVPRVHPIVEQYTSETYGVMVYQEQVMQIVHGLGGIKLRDAYSLIKNISKKKHDKIEKERPKFIDGAVKQGLTKDKANELFELILKFAGYGFNKSHSTGYAIVAYQTAYLKTYFPNQYMAAFLTFESGSSQVSEWVPYLEDCKNTRFVDPKTGKPVRVGVEVRPPDVNMSQADFAVVFEKDEPRTSHSGHVRFGIGAIKGVGDKAIESIIKERDGERKRDEETKKDHADATSSSPRPFTSLFDFCERVPVGGSGGNGGAVNKATIEALIRSGAMDCLHGRAMRSAMIASVEPAVSAGVRAQADKASGQGALFGMFAEPPASAGGKPAAGALLRVPPWTETETLAQEKEALGFYISSHPLDQHKWLITGLSNANTRMLRERAIEQDKRVVMGGLVQSVRTLIVKSGKSAGSKMGIVKLEDRDGVIESVAFSDVFAKYSDMMTTDRVVFAVGKVDYSRGEPQLILERIMDVSMGVTTLCKKVRITLDELKLNGSAQRTLEQVAAFIKEPPAPIEECPAVGVEFIVKTETAEVQVELAKARLSPASDVLKPLKMILGEGQVTLVGGPPEKTENERKPWEKRGPRGGD